MKNREELVKAIISLLGDAPYKVLEFVYYYILYMADHMADRK